MSKQDGVAVRTASDLERKYNFGKQFEEVIGLVNDARGAISEVDSELRSLFSSTSFTRDAEQIVLKALQEYTKTNDLDELLTKKLETEFSISPGEIFAKVSKLEETVEQANLDKLNEAASLIAKCFTLDINGLTIGAVDANGSPLPNKVVIDNDDITIEINNTPIVTLKADGTSEIPSLSISEQLKVCGLKITEEDTHISIDYVGWVNG